MNRRTWYPTYWGFPLWAAAVILPFFGGRLASAKGPDWEFYGVLTVAIEDETARQLQITPEQKKKLIELIDARDSEALELAMKLKDLAPAERAGRLEPFRRESEQRGMALLSDAQRAKLESIRLRRLGLTALGEHEVAQRFKLSAKQEEDIRAILKQRAERLAKSNEPFTQPLDTPTERAIVALLSEDQRTAWETARTLDQAPVVAAAPLSSPPAAAAPPAATPPAATSPTAKPELKPASPVAMPSAPAKPASGLSAAPAATPAATPAKPASGLSTAPAAAPAAAPTTAPAPAGPVAKRAPPKLPGPDTKLRFNFRFQPWRDVLDWFAEQAGLSLVMDAPPAGTFNYADDREYTPAESLDLLNSVLLTKGYTLVRRDRMLIVVNLQDGVPPNLVPVISVDELPKRGEFELVSVLFPLERISPEEAEAEIKKLLGPQGTVVVLAGSRQVVVTETAGRLRSVSNALKRQEGTEGTSSSPVRAFDLRHANAQAVLEVLRQLLDIPADKYATTDGSVRFAIDNANQRLLVSGKPDRVARVQEILKTLDVPDAKGSPALGAEGAQQLEVYAITGADPESVLKVMQTLLTGGPEVRLALDPKTNALVAMARPSQHATIRATLEQLQRDGRKMEVVPLRLMDPQVAVLSLKKLFEGSPAPPQIDADLTNRQLLIHGTEAQIQQIRSVLEKMGEGGAREGFAGGSDTVRVLPMSGRSARSALERIQEIWPTLHQNKIRVVTPSSTIPSIMPAGDAPSETPGAAAADPALLDLLMRQSKGREPGPGASKTPAPAAKPESKPESKPAEKPQPAPEAKPAAPAAKPGAPSGSAPPPNPKTARLFGAQVTLVAESAPAASPPKPAAPTTPPQPAATPSRDPPPIIVSPGPGGVLVACEDPQVLNEFEQLLTTLAGPNMTPTSNYTIFYLKHAKAAAIAETLDGILGGGTLASESRSGGRGGSLMGDLAGAAFGRGGEMMSSLMGMAGDSGGGSSAPSSGSTKITPDTRLNALIVQAAPNDLDTIEQLLKILDQKETPQDVLVAAKPRIIPVNNMQATEVADILRQVYQDRMQSGQGQSGGQRQPNPMEFIAMLRGGRRGSGGGSKAAEEPQKMSIGVDMRANTLIVVAPDELFREVQTLVEQIDADAMDSSQTMRVVTLEKTSLSAVQRALTALTGGNVQSTGGMGSSMFGSRPFGSTVSSGMPTPPVGSTGYGTGGSPGFGGFSRRFGGGMPGGMTGGMPGGMTGGGMPGGPTGGMPGGTPGGMPGSPTAPPGGQTPGGFPFGGPGGFGSGMYPGGGFGGFPGGGFPGGSGGRSSRSYGGSSSGRGFSTVPGAPGSSGFSPRPSGGSRSGRR